MFQDNSLCNVVVGMIHEEVFDRSATVFLAISSSFEIVSVTPTSSIPELSTLLINFVKIVSGLEGGAGTAITGKTAKTG